MITHYLLMPGAVLNTGDVLDNPPNVGEGRGAAPVVVVDTTARQGERLRVFGTDGHTSWWVRGARGSVVIDRSVYQLSDPLAPVNVPIIYYFQDEDGNETQITQTARGFAGAGVGHTLLTDAHGIMGASVFRFRDEDVRSPSPRQESFAIPGRPSPVVRWDTTLEGAVVWQVGTSGQATEIVRNLLSTGEPLIFHHDRGRCPLPGCDVPGAQVGLVTGVSSKVSRRMDLAERVWDVTFQVVADPFADILAPASTVAMHDAYHAGLTVAEHDALYAGSTVLEVDQVVWA